MDADITKIAVRDRPGTVIINVCFFGVKKLNLSRYKKSVIVEDITHDIFAYRNSAADYCFASLRKLLPVPCGGFCCSPAGKDLPAAKPNLKSENIAFQKITSMFLKREYLEGRVHEKEIWRGQFIDAEKRFQQEFTTSEMPAITQTIFSRLNIKRILDEKKKNLNNAFSSLKKNKLNELIVYTTENALGLFLMMPSSNQRERLKAYLISKNIFPAILWPDQTNRRDKQIEKRILFLHVDYRYDGRDIKYITDTVNLFFK